jgi:hypothetical protein
MLTNRTHPKYSLAMEILSLLPCRFDRLGNERYAAIADIVVDLGLELQSDVRDRIKQIEAMGIRLERFNVRDAGHALAVARESWGRAKEKCDEYWSKVYGAETEAA